MAGIVRYCSLTTVIWRLDNTRCQEDLKSGLSQIAIATNNKNT